MCGETAAANSSDSCSDKNYYNAHRCECDPKPSNCCIQDWAEAEGMVFDQATRTCKCPEGTVLYQDPNSYWRCHGGLAWKEKGARKNVGECPPYTLESTCEKTCSVPGEECYIISSGGSGAVDENNWGAGGQESRATCYRQDYICTDN